MLNFFFPHLCILQDLWSRVVKGINEQQEGLYNFKPMDEDVIKPCVTANFYDYTAPESVRNKDKVILWHRRLGHISCDN